LIINKINEDNFVEADLLSLVETFSPLMVEYRC
jgi:hypothetical protein